MQYQSIIPYPADVPCQGPLPSSDLFNHIYDHCLFSYTYVCFLFWYTVFNVLLSIFDCTAASLFFAWVVSVHVSAPYIIAGSTYEL